jgi:hypothetical protein
MESEGAEMAAGSAKHHRGLIAIARSVAIPVVLFGPCVMSDTAGEVGGVKLSVKHKGFAITGVMRMAVACRSRRASNEQKQ